MIRYLYSIGFALGCVGLPLQAKGTNPASDEPTPAKSSHLETKAVATSTTPAAANHDKLAKADSKTVASSVPVTVRPTPTPKAADKAATTIAPAATPHAKSTITTAKTSDRESPANTASITKSRTNTSAHAACLSAFADVAAAGERLARLTAYWASEGDYYTSHGISSTGIHLHDGLCAVDPRIIPYGSVVTIAGVGKYLAVDTGSAVISREAAREAAHTATERNALVIDLYFESRRDGEAFASTGPKYASISWWTPGSTGHDAKAARSLFADENWSKIQGKQL